jgi:hypothetical protein
MIRPKQLFPLFLLVIVFIFLFSARELYSSPYLIAQEESVAECAPKRSREAFATMLTSGSYIDDLQNKYFLSARLVVSRLSHHPRVRTLRDVIGTAFNQF